MAELVAFVAVEFADGGFAEEEAAEGRVFFGFGAEEIALEKDGGDAGALVGFHLSPEKGACDEGKSDYGEEVFCFCAGDEEHGEEYGHKEQDCAEVGFEEDEDDGQEGEGEWAQQGEETFLVGTVAEEPGQGEDES